MNGSAVRLSGRVAVITGAASGIGLATARLFAREGASVVLADVQETTDVAEEIAAAGGAAWAAQVDVSDPEQVRELMAGAVDRAGRLDVLVAAAGVGGGTAPTAEYPDADFQRVLAINLGGVFYSMKYAIPWMLRGGGGAIVTISSIMGLVGLPTTPAYSAAKGGVVQLTKVAALEYAEQGIRVNCICPGMIDTPMLRRTSVEARDAFVERQPLRRLGSATEVAEAALYLASDASTFTTGVVLPIDGGYLAQ